MLYSLFRYYIRVFNRNRIYTFFNIGGLALGLAISLIVILYLEHEATYDRHYDQHEQIYRVATHFELEDDFLLAMSAMGIGPLLEREYDNIESFVRIGSVGDDVFITYQEKTIYEDLVYYSDTTYFDIFLTPFFEGDPQKCLKSPNNIVLTKSLAVELFGNEPALGKVISTSN